MQKIFYEGADIVVRGNLDRPGRDLVFAFGFRANGLPKRAFGERFCEASGYPSVHFLSRRPIWWQSDEMLLALDALDKALDRSLYKRVVSYGSSMGAYGALMFAGALAVDRVVAFAPQISINERLAPWRDDWWVDTREIVEQFRLEENLPTRSEVILLYDPRDSFDSIHARKIEELVPWSRSVPVPFSQHGTSNALAEAGVLGKAMRGLVTGELSAGDVRRLVRDARRNSLGYWSGMRRALVKHRKTALADAVAAQQGGMLERHIAGGHSSGGREFHSAVLEHCLALAEAGRGRDAENLITRLIANDQGAPDPYVVSAKYYQKRGKQKISVRDAEYAYRLDRSNLRNKVLYIQVLFGAGENTRAQEQLLELMDNPRNLSLKNWRAIHSSARGADLPSATLSKLSAFAHVVD